MGNGTTSPVNSTGNDEVDRTRLDPWRLPSSYFPVAEKSSRRTPSGFWREIKSDDTKIRSDEWSSQTLGRRTTLEFYRKNRTKTDWVMHEYRLYGAVPAFSLERGIYRKVFKKDSYEPASWYHADNNGGNPVRYNSELMDMYDTLRDGDKLAQREPWELPRYFIVKNNLSRSSLRTKSGVWIEKEDDLIAVRSPESSSSTTTTTTPPSYVGVKKTFEFSLNDGTKTDWVMREYLQLHHNWSYPAASFVQDPGQCGVA